MPSINVTERDFELLAEAANDAQEQGNLEAAEGLDKLARKANAALAHYNCPGRLLCNTKNSRLDWRDVPSTLVHLSTPTPEAE